MVRIGPSSARISIDSKSMTSAAFDAWRRLGRDGMDRMIPGVSATGKRVEVGVVVIVG
jgi:hypothetical protein